MFPETCKYTKFINTNGNGGTIQNGISTQKACQDRCNGKGLTNGLTCYGYDFNIVNKQCYIFTTKGYTKSADGSVPNVNHYVKDPTCGGSGTQASLNYLP